MKEICGIAWLWLETSELKLMRGIPGEGGRCLLCNEEDNGTCRSLKFTKTDAEKTPEQQVARHV
jgi:hypothetical protein